MARDPFEITQYVTSFSIVENFEIGAFDFANLNSTLEAVAEAIELRQIAISVAYGFDVQAFINVSNFSGATPTNLVQTVTNFQIAIKEFVEGSIINAFGVLEGCGTSPFIGFFNFSNGLPIIGIENIAFTGFDFTPVPQEIDFGTAVQFAKEIGDTINELIFSINLLVNIHSPMFIDYPFQDSCIEAPGSQPLVNPENPTGGEAPSGGSGPPADLPLGGDGGEGGLVIEGGGTGGGGLPSSSPFTV